MFKPEDVTKLQTYLQSRFGDGFAIKFREKAPDSVEVIHKGEFIGVIYKDEEDGETSFSFTMTILDIDLKKAA